MTGFELASAIGASERTAGRRSSFLTAQALRRRLPRLQGLPRWSGGPFRSRWCPRCARRSLFADRQRLRRAAGRSSSFRPRSESADPSPRAPRGRASLPKLRLMRCLRRGSQPNGTVEYFNRRWFGTGRSADEGRGSPRLAIHPSRMGHGGRASHDGRDAASAIGGIRAANGPTAGTSAGRSSSAGPTARSSIVDVRHRRAARRARERAGHEEAAGGALSRRVLVDRFGTS